MSELAAEPRMLIDGKLVARRRGRRTGTSTRLPRRSRARSPTPARRHGPGHRSGAGRSTTPTGRRTPRSGSGASSSSRTCRQGEGDAAIPARDRGRHADHAVRGAAGLCIEDMQWEIDLIDRYEWERRYRRTSSWACTAPARSHEPIGVVGAITPELPVHAEPVEDHAALAAGNTVVLKPAPDTPWSATFIGRGAEQTDIPPGVLNVVTSGDAATVGEMLTTDPRVDLVSFTGSTATGRRIMASGGDAEEGLPRARRQVRQRDPRRRRLRGRRAVGLDDPCTAARASITTRMLLPKSHYDEAVDMLKAAFENVPYGDPTDPGNIMGPLINARSATACSATSRRARRRAPSSSSAAAARAPRHGLLRRADVVRRRRPGATIAQEEIFGRSCAC